MVENGELKSLKDRNIKCVDCGHYAIHYDHRDYAKPKKVEPVCGRCNSKRGHARYKGQPAPYEVTKKFDKLVFMRCSNILKKKIIEMAKKEGVSESELVRNSVEYYLEEKF